MRVGDGRRTISATRLCRSAFSSTTRRRSTRRPTPSAPRLQVRTRETFPISWATSRLNLGNALSSVARFDMGTGSLEEAAAAYGDALTVFTRAAFSDGLGVGPEQSRLDLPDARPAHPRRRPGSRQSAAAFQAAPAGLHQTDIPARLGDEPLQSRQHAAAAWRPVTDKPGTLQARRSTPIAMRCANTSARRTPRQWALAQAGLGSALHWLSMSNADPKTLAEFDRRASGGA